MKTLKLEPYVEPDKDAKLLKVIDTLYNAGEAYVILKQTMQDDPSLAWSWHCTIAMGIYDSLKDKYMPHSVAHHEANETAANIMQNLFKVDVRQCAEWKATFATKQTEAKYAPAEGANKLILTPASGGTTLTGLIPQPLSILKYYDPETTKAVGKTAKESLNKLYSKKVASYTDTDSVSIKFECEFKIGDRVRFITPFPFGPGSDGVNEGDIGTVVSEVQEAPNFDYKRCEVAFDNGFTVYRILQCLELVPSVTIIDYDEDTSNILEKIRNRNKKKVIK